MVKKHSVSNKVITLDNFRFHLPRKRETTRDQRLIAALCHASILLNLFSLIGGIAFCAVFYLISRKRAYYVSEQASKALVYQVVVWGIILSGWLFYRMLPEWLGALIFWPLGALVWFAAILLALVKASRCL